MNSSRWCEVRCAQLRAELDAYYARLYGLTRDELRYTHCGVDPKEVYSEDLPSEVNIIKNDYKERINSLLELYYPGASLT